MSKTYYSNARIITGLGNVIENGLVVVEHKQSIGKLPVISDVLDFVGDMGSFDFNSVLTPEDEVVDLTGYTILPGLYDVNTHLDLMNESQNDYVDNMGTPYRTFLSFRHAAEALNSGVTTIRITGMPDDIDIALRNSINKNMVFGPTLLASGPEYITTKGKGYKIYGAVEASGADALRTQARINLSKGLDFITIGISGERLASLGGEYEKQMSDKEIEALTDLAHAFEKPIAADCSGDTSVKAALKYKVTSIEHGYKMSDALIEEMAKNGTYYVPALCSTHGENVDPVVKEEHRAVVSKAIKSGVKICVGTDVLPSEPMDGTVAIVREIELLCELGMTPMNAIQAATSVSAELCKTKNSSGTLEKGKQADFIGIKGMPDKKIEDLRNMSLVVKNGRRAFCITETMKERAFHIHAPLYIVDGGTLRVW